MFKSRLLWKKLNKQNDVIFHLTSTSKRNTMQKTNTQITNDLQQFIDKFQPSKFKLLTRGIEIRGNNDLHRSITAARELIERMKLKLTIEHSAEMAMYGGFEVIYAA